MRLIKALQRRRLMTFALAAACVIVGGVAVWQASKFRVEASTQDKQRAMIAVQDKQRLQLRLQKGVGSEVRFASVDAKPEQVADAVDSAAEFIYWRSGLKMSEETKKELTAAESDVLSGNASPISVADLTEKLTAGAVERLATITDEEIQQVAEVSADQYGQVSSRANGKWGVMSTKELLKQAKSARDWSQRGDGALQSTLHSMIEEEVNDRVSTLGAALPAQFGRAGAQGVTPTQALLIAYSVAADDPLTDSRSDIQQLTMQMRMDAGQTREQKRAQKGFSGRPYGPHGVLHPSAPHLFFNKPAIDRLLATGKGGGK
jgi:hypothetical protein